MREFICVEVTEPSSFDALFSDRLFSDRCIRDARTAGLHFTLHFLGEVEETENPEISGLIDSVASRHRKFTITFRGAGAFPNERMPAVIWAGVPVCAELEKIHNELACGLNLLGIPVERREYMPHVTLARVRCRPDAASLNEFFGRWANRHIGGQEVRSISLKQSVLSRSGAVHRTIHASQLNL